MKIVPINSLHGVLPFVLIVKNVLPNKTPMMLDLMFAKFEKG
jgi:hypothetical protein